MGQPVLAFLEDEFGIGRKTGAVAFGATVFGLGFICLWLYPAGPSTSSTLGLAPSPWLSSPFLEVIVFAWVFGMDRGWEEITRGLSNWTASIA